MGIPSDELFIHWPPPDNCESCGEQPATHIDHNHSTNEFRGWLCNKSNAGLGMFNDDLTLILRAADYLRRHWGDKTELHPEQVYDFKMEYKGG